MRARSVGAVVPNDIGMAEREKRLDVRLGVAPVSAILNEAVMIVQVLDRFAILEPAEPLGELGGISCHAVSRPARGRRGSCGSRAEVFRPPPAARDRRDARAEPSEAPRGWPR